MSSDQSPSPSSFPSPSPPPPPKVYFPLGDPESYNEYAEIMHALNMTEQAAVYFREAGAIAHKIRDFKKAHTYFNRALMVQPDR